MIQRKYHAGKIQISSFKNRAKREKNVNQDKDEAAQEFMEEVVGDLGYTPKAERNQRSRSSVDLKFSPKHLISGGIGILVLISIIAFFFTGKTDSYKEDLDAIQAGLNKLEERLKSFGELENRIVRLENQDKKLWQSVKNIAARNSKTYKKKPSSTKKKTSKIKKRYHTVQAGDSLYSIAKKYGISTDKLCKINKITPKKPLQPGQKLLVGR